MSKSCVPIKNKCLRNFLAKNKRVFLRGIFAIAHRRMIEDYLKSHQVRKLQIGSGHNVLKGWLNTDININKQIVFLDATKRFPFDDCTFDYVFCEHLIEHLEYLECERMLRECWRILKPGGKIRISTPDLRFLIELYSDNKSDLQERYIHWAVNKFLPEIKVYLDTFVINHFFKAWGHKFIYDYKTLYYLLSKCGFVNIKRYAPKESDDENLKNIESHGKSIGDEFNNLESMVIEAVKPAYCDSA